MIFRHHRLPPPLSDFIDLLWYYERTAPTHAMERALVMGASDQILPEDLPEEILDAAPAESGSSANYQSTVKEQKKQLVLKDMQDCKGNYIDAAKILGIHPNSLLRLIRNLGLKGTTSEAQRNN